MSQTRQTRQTSPVPSFASLSEAEQRQVAERLLKIEQSGWKPFWCPDPKCSGDPHLLPDGTVDPKWAHNHARPDQRLLPWRQPWTLLCLSGRGAGKTELGAQFIHLNHRKGVNTAILGRRGTELVNTHVDRIVKTAHPEFLPEYLASKDILVWPNGTTTYLFSAEKPENIRSINVGAAWVDEAAHMPEIETAWMNLELATRIETPGNPIHTLITTTPTPTPWMMKMEDDPAVEVRRVSTYVNRKNLSKDFIATLEKEYEGTRMGRQELHGEVLRDVEGALWNDGMFNHLRLDPEQFEDLLDSLDDVVVAVDPAGSKGKRSDATGVVAVGTQVTDDDGDPLRVSNIFVLADATLKGSPSEWAEQTFKVARMVRARRLVAEKNFGGDMVKQVLQDWAKAHPDESRDADGDEFRIKVVHAVKSKETRAEGTVGKYEQGRVTHVTGNGVFSDLSALEKEMCSWVPKSRGGKFPSPNRVDALVWAVREVEVETRFPAQQASRDVLKRLKRRGF